VSLEAAIATNRFGLGARPGELRDAGADPRGWLRRQLTVAELPPEIRRLPDSAHAFQQYDVAQQSRRQSRKSMDDDAPPTKERDASPRNLVLPLYLDQVAARYQVAQRTNRSFHERLVHFWTNHFAVSADKLTVLALAGTLENEAIRPHLHGSFADLLLAVEAHPAMILYLDNQASIGPSSLVAQRVAKRARQSERKLGINENLAREILELHTLGVNGGYSQTDVTAFACALTGWSVGSARGPIAQGRPGTFEFRDNAHEPGSQVVLGKRNAEAGAEQPRAILRDLAIHEATATHIAAKLVRHFIADTPPPDAVARIATTFQETRGHLPSVHAALIELPDAWTREQRKLRTPHEFVVAALRMFDVIPQRPQQILAPFQMLGQRPYTPGSPAGWPDVASQWDGPDALLSRIEWSTQVGARIGKTHSPVEAADNALGELLTARTRQAIARAESAAQGIALLLASPEFQRR